eukprot:gnl/TRDRNA2_/TRDRNA2_160614_c0_seq5.p1 gnl/TRDRNA2_/TRDRNA2_160614_c0~~gnl/TRDRNA2_/TRDRNA2_160614_c0_seq5.p1  ORF type:complete len:410 (+),score=39.44 gnl/TRDRNA2_/TRDRNA2_160614_c0_seq5:60-1289(+)
MMYVVAAAVIIALVDGLRLAEKAPPVTEVTKPVDKSSWEANTSDLPRSVQTRKNVARYKQPMENYHDMHYVGDISIGGQVLKCILDTGSFQILAFSKVDCPASQCHTSGMYDRFHSSTFQWTMATYEAEFGSGTVKAKGGLEKVSIGPADLMVAHDQLFWYVYEAHLGKLLELNTINAIVGLGPPKVTMGYNTILTSLGIHHFSACRLKDWGSIGYTIWNDDLFLEPEYEFKTIEVMGKYTWSRSMAAPSLQHGHGQQTKVGGATCHPTCGVLFDTGTSLVAMPDSMYYEIHSQLQGIFGSGSGDCQIDQLPDLVFDIAGHEFRLHPPAYVSQVTSSVGISCQLSILKLGDNMGIDTNFGPLIILGMPFFFGNITPHSTSGLGKLTERFMSLRPTAPAILDPKLMASIL